MTPLSSDPTKRTRQLANLRPGAKPAPKGNSRAATHSAYAKVSSAQLDKKAREILEALTADAPVREDDGSLPAADAPAVRMLADALVRLDTISTFLDQRGWLDDDGKERPVLVYEGRLRGHALDLMRELGMTPASRAKLGLELVRTAAAVDEAEAARAARERLDRRAAAIETKATEEATA